MENNFWRDFSEASKQLFLDYIRHQMGEENDVSEADLIVWDKYTQVLYENESCLVVLVVDSGGETLNVVPKNSEYFDEGAGLELHPGVLSEARKKYFADKNK